MGYETLPNNLLYRLCYMSTCFHMALLSMCIAQLWGGHPYYESLASYASYKCIHHSCPERCTQGQNPKPSGKVFEEGVQIILVHIMFRVNVLCVYSRWRTYETHKEQIIWVDNLQHIRNIPWLASGGWERLLYYSAVMWKGLCGYQSGGVSSHRCQKCPNYSLDGPSREMLVG